MEDFQEIMEAKSDRQLIQMIDHESHKYTSQAISSAEKVLENRKLNPALVDQLREEIKQELKEQRAEAQKASDSLIFNDANSEILDAPISKAPKDRRNIKILSGLFLIYFLWSAYSSFKYLFFSFSIHSLFVIFLLGINLTAAVGTFSLKKIGWISTIGFASFILSSSLITVFYNYFMFSEVSFGELISNGNAYKFLLIPLASLLIFTAAIFFILNYFWNPRIRKLFQVENKVAILTLAICICSGIIMTIISILSLDSNF